MGTIGSVVLVVLIVIIVLNICVAATKKKRDGSTRVRYEELFAPIESAILSEDESWNAARVKRIVTEEEKGILAALDDGKKRAVIGWNGGSFPFSYKDYVSAEVDARGLTLTVKTRNDSVELTLSEGKHRKDGSASKPVKEMGRIMKEFLDTIKKN
ncbi:MAG: hypothetical protein SOZ46_01750 [Bullifex sp.]|nr:hypothetical protein [Bullifex sp.]MDY4798344.1 hypothetical protein [Bullifex sp.]MDY5056256.1 hypothetical protein [Bullifex sp.]